MNQEVLKLYRGENVVQQNLEDLDPDRWLVEGELMILLEVPKEEKEVGSREQSEEQVRPELHPEPALDIPMIPEDPEVIAENEGVNKRIQADIQHKDKEAEVAEVVIC